jgi:hypothetical protein
VRLRADGSLDLEQSDEEFSLRWAALAGLVGLAFLALAVVADVRWKWEDIWPSVLLEIGAAIALVVVILELERRIIRRVRRATEPARCTLRTPDSLIRQVGVWDHGTVYSCDHTPQHRWDLSGQRMADQPTPESP